MENIEESPRSLSRESFHAGQNGRNCKSDISILLPWDRGALAFGSLNPRQLTKKWTCSDGPRFKRSLPSQRNRWTRIVDKIGWDFRSLPSQFHILVFLPDRPSSSTFNPFFLQQWNCHYCRIYSHRVLNFPSLNVSFLTRFWRIIAILRENYFLLAWNPESY